MPTFSNHWAGISGSIEEDDINPFEAAVRELQEETNLLELFAKYNSDNENESGTNKDTTSTSLRSCINQGLNVDVSSNNSKGAFGGRIIRVYPFALTLPIADGKSTKQTNEDCATSSSIWSRLEMEGTEHDEMKFVNIKQFLEMKDPCVPSLKLAFHHATCGSYLELPKDIRSWEQDRENGAAFLAQKAVVLAAAHYTNTATNNNDDTEQPNVALSIAMLRPSMVPIVNVMKEFDCSMQQSQDYNKVRDELLHSLDDEIEKCVDLAVEDIVRYHKEWEQSASSFDKANGYTIGTFSRSSTMKKILKQVLRVHLPSANIKVLCSQSTPGNEGEIMATDICANWLPDDSFKKEVRFGKINLVLMGADCILQDGNGVVNKVGTAELAACCKQSNVPIICCADRWKLWEDIYPPALEDIFELVPSETIDHVLVPVDGKNDNM